MSNLTVSPNFCLGTQCQTEETMEEKQIAVEMRDMHKIYPNGTVANSGVNFSVAKGEVHALVGENGAGKSTLMKVLYGLEERTGGQVEIFGKSNLGEIALEYSLPVLARLPIDPNVAALCDAGKMEQADVSGVMPAAELMAKA